MGYPISHIIGFDGQTYDLGGGGANIWPGAWTELNGSKYSNINIPNRDYYNKNAMRAYLDEILYLVYLINNHRDKNIKINTTLSKVFNISLILDIV